MKPKTNHDNPSWVLINKLQSSGLWEIDSAPFSSPPYLLWDGSKVEYFFFRLIWSVKAETSQICEWNLEWLARLKRGVGLDDLHNCILNVLIASHDGFPHGLPALIWWIICQIWILYLNVKALNITALYSQHLSITKLQYWTNDLRAAIFINLDSCDCWRI